MVEEVKQQPLTGDRHISQLIRTKDPIDPQTRQWQLSSYDIVEEMRQRLSGKIPDDTSTGTSITWKEVTESLANEDGINEICSIVSFYLNKNIHLSWFSPDQINEIMKDFEGMLTRKLEFDWDKMGIRKEDVDQIFTMVANTVWAAINRARFGGEKQFIESTEQRTILSNESTDKKGKSFFDNIPIIGGK